MFSTTLHTKIRNLVANLSKKSYKQSISEINNLLEMSGEESRMPLIVSLIFEVDFRDQRSPINLQKIQTLTEEIANAMKRPNFVSLFCQVIEEYLMQRSSQYGPKPVEEFLVHFLRSVKLSSLQLLMFGFALTRSINTSISFEGRKVIRAKLPEIIQANFAEVCEEIIYQFLHYLSQSEDISPEVYISILKSLRSTSLPMVFPNLLAKLTESKDQFRSNQPRLTNYLLELGSNCSSSVESLRAAVRSSGIPLTEEQVADVLVVFICKATETVGDSVDKKWNLEVITDTLSQECKNLNWTQVIRSLDHPGLTLRTDITFQILITMIIRISGAPIPAAGLMGLWRNKQTQLELIVRCTQLPASKVDFSTLLSADQQLPQEVPAPANLSWMCLPVYSTLMQLASNGLTMEVLEALKPAAINYPEYVMISMCRTQDQGGGVRVEMLRKTLPLFSGLKGSRPTSFLVMKKLVSCSQDVLVSLLRYSLKRARFISEVNEIEVRLKSLGMGIARRVEEESNLDEILSLLCARADRGEILLEEKLRAYIEKNPQYIKVMLAFAKDHLDSLRPRSSDGGVLSMESLHAILKEGQSQPGVVSMEEYRPFFAAMTQVQQQLANGIVGNQQPPQSQQQQPLQQQGQQRGSDDVENEANAYFQKIYKSEISISEVITLLKKFKSSTDKREQDIFRCMIYNLFDEYRFFHKYPEKELQVTGVLFGSLIQHQLVASMTLGITLRYILEALRKDPDLGVNNDKIFRFGKIALEQFKTRLVDWPQYCTHLVQIPHFAKHAPELFREAKEALGNPNAGGNSSASEQMSIDGAMQYVGGSNASASDIVNSIQQQAMADGHGGRLDGQGYHHSSRGPSIIDHMLIVNGDVHIEFPPPDNVRDKIQMIFNNIDKSNQDSKIPEIKGLLIPDYFSWFADFLVKRIGSQQNLHPLYLTILDAIDNSQLWKVLLDVVYYNATKLLASPKIASSSSERQVLRNLGIWIGVTTLARNKPILQRKLNLKALLFWGYETGLLIAVCSFVARILEGVKDSKIFKPPNPWLMAVLGVMRELLDMEDLKMHVKFEIQVLCRNINMRIEDIPKENLLQTCAQPNKDNSPDFNSKNPSTLQSPTLSGKSLEDMDELGKQLPATVQLPGAAVPPTPPLPNESSAQEHTVIPNLSNYLVINPSIQFFANNPAQKRLVSLAVDRAIRELIQPVAERASTIAGVSTKMIILKDFATEPNEQLLRHHAHIMISNLAGSLALITCKEALRLSICNHLRTLLAQATNDQNLIESICQVCSHDNLEIGCMVIEKAAMEKAIREIDEMISAACQARRKQRESGQPYVDTTVYPKSTKYPKELPEFLRPRVGGLSPQQLVVYESFQRTRNATPQSSSLSSPIVTGSAPQGLVGGDIKPLPATQAVLTVQQAQEAYQQVFARLDQAFRTYIAQAPGRELSISMLGNNAELLMMLREFRLITERTQVAARVESCLTFAEKVFKRLLESIGSIELIRAEAMILVLEALRDGDPKRLSSDMVNWLTLYSTFNVSEEPCRKMLRTVLTLCLRAKLLRSQDIDAYFATFMDNGRNVIWMDLALEFVKLCLSERLAATYEFPKIFDTVSKMRTGSPAFRKQLQTTLTELKALANAMEVQKTAEPPATGAATVTPAAVSKDLSAMREQVTALLEKWFRVWSSISETTFTQYLQLMHQFGVLKTEDAADKFFRVATELCIEHCLKTGQLASSDSTGTLQYTVIDALSKLFILLMKQADRESADVTVRANLLGRILAAVARTLISDHDNKRAQRLSFDQRPYFRILSNLSQDLGVADPKKEVNAALHPLLTCYVQIYSALQPLNVPGFTFAWVQLVSQRSFLPHLMLIKGQRGWGMVHRLLSNLLLFLHPFLKAVQMNDVIRKLYKACLRILLILLHDFPEFLCEYHLALCDMIPANCVHMRNLVLSAFPRSIRVPDPFLPNLKADMLPEITQPPRIQADYFNQLTERGLRGKIESYMTSKTPADLPATLVQQIVVPGGISLSLLNAVIVYVGSLGAHQLANKIGLSNNSPAMDIYKALLQSLDFEGRFLVLNCIANQLRYPNSHTHFFSYVILMLFAEADSEFLQEQITRVLFERVIVNRPHPWGVLITFVELIKNSRYGFWSKSFTRCAPEIERVIESVARSCINPSSGNAAGTSGSGSAAGTSGGSNAASASLGNATSTSGSGAATATR